MKKKLSTLSTDIIIQNLVAAMCGESTTAREKHIYLETLRGLVRLAKSEQMQEIRMNVDKLSGSIAMRTARRRARALIDAHRIGSMARSGQTELEFNQG